MTAIDKQQILKPDYTTPFQSLEDVFNRLQPFYRILDFKEETPSEGITHKGLTFLTYQDRIPM